VKFLEILFSVLILFCSLGCSPKDALSRNFSRPPVILSFENASPVDFGLVGTGAVGEYTITMQVDGGIAADNITASATAPFSLKGGSYPGTGGTCTSTEQNSTCTIVVNYSPVVVGLDTGTLTIDYSVQGVDSQTTLGLSGYTQAVLTISDGPTYNYGIKAVGSITDFTLTVSRTGGGAAATSMGSPVMSAPFSYKGGTYPGTGATCTSTLATGAPSCTIVVTYSPTTLASHSDTLTLSYNNGIANTSTTRAFAGTGVPPAVLTLSTPGVQNFGTRAVGSATNFTYTVTYTSGGVPAMNLSGTGILTNFIFIGGSYPGTGGTCGTTLASGTCTIRVRFTPQSVATHNGTMAFNYHDGAFFQQITRDMTGVGVPPAVLSESGGTPFNFGVRQTGTGADYTFNISYVSGGVSATGLAVSGFAAPITYKGGTFPGTGGTCPTTIPSGTNCTIIIRYAPTVTGTFTNNLLITYNNGAANQTISRQITGTTQAGLSISDGATYNFGNQVTGSTTSKTFTVTRTGGIDATAVVGYGLAAPYTFLGGSYPGTGGTCGVTISTATCTVIVAYTPTTQAVHNDTINIDYFDGFNPQTASRPMTGTGVLATVLTVSDAGTFDFGTKATGSLTDKTYTLTYVSGTIAATGIGVTTFAAPFTYKGGAFPGTGGTCATSLASGSCTIIVTYAPTTAALHSRTVTFNYNDGAVVQNVSRSMQGTGVAPAVLTVSDSGTYDFGPRQTGTSTDKTYTVTYTSGGVVATSMTGSGLSTPFTFKGGSYPGTGGTCTTTLAGGTCTVIVSYSPVAVGSASGTFTFSYNDGASTQNQNRSVQGNTEGLLTISDGATYDYGSMATGSTTAKIFTISFTGGLPATAMSGLGLSAPFTFTGGAYPGTSGSCAATLSSGTCTVDVTYSPVTVALHSSTLQISYNNGYVGTSSTRNVQGTGILPATLTFLPATLYSFGNRATGSTTDVTMTVSYSGTAPATSMAGAGVANPYSFKGGSYPGTGGTCGPTISSGTCTVVVTYSPNSVATHNGTVSVNYDNGASTQTASRNLTGVGQALAYLTISDGPTYNFGTQSVGTTTSKTFTVTNVGSVNATSMGGAGLAAPYTFKGGSYPGTGGSCSNSQAPGSCTILVNYSPTATGISSDTILVNYNDSSSGQQATRDITGTGAFAPLMAADVRAFVDEIRPTSIPLEFNISDLNQDGIKEILGFNRKSEQKSHPAFGVEIYDGESFKRILNIPNPNKNYEGFGLWASVADDFDGDGIEDFVISSPLFSVSHNILGKIYFIGSQKKLIFDSLIGGISMGQLGQEIYDYVDVNQDGLRELILIDKFNNIFVYDEKNKRLEMSIFDE